MSGRRPKRITAGGVPAATLCRVERSLSVRLVFTRHVVLCLRKRIYLEKSISENTPVRGQDGASFLRNSKMDIIVVIRFWRRSPGTFHAYMTGAFTKKWDKFLN